MKIANLMVSFYANSAGRKTAQVLGLLAFLAAMYLTCAQWADAAEIAPLPPNSSSFKSASAPRPASIWLTSVGCGFRKGTEVLGLGAGATYGLLMFGGEDRHHLALGRLSYGRMVGGLKKEGHWYGGNWEFRMELLGGGQITSHAAYFLGLTPHLRYHFATGSRWVPFVDAGFGISLTDIGHPDLGDKFQFNTQLGAGIHWFMKESAALVLEGRYLHISSAGLSMPNDGVNTAGLFFGINWFF